MNDPRSAVAIASEVDAAEVVPVDPAALAARLEGAIARAFVGHAGVVRTLVAALFAGGHVLIDDVPGTGKTTLAKALAAALATPCKRVQFTPDLLPGDLTGVSLWVPQTQSFRFVPGPVFTHVLLADEINRASPRTQAALLEAMGEGQVSVDGEPRALPEPFFVVATQNPFEFHGTFPLPEAQLDRFAVRLRLGALGIDDEVAMLAAVTAPDAAGALGARVDVAPVATVAQLRAARRAVRAVRVADRLHRYVVALVGATRLDPAVALGASPRAAVTLLEVARALAAISGDAFVAPEHVQAVAVDVLAHRLVADAAAHEAPEAAVLRALAQVPVPA